MKGALVSETDLSQSKLLSSMYAIFIVHVVPVEIFITQQLL